MRVTDEHRELARKFAQTPGICNFPKRLFEEEVARALAERDKVMIERCVNKIDSLMDSEGLTCCTETEFETFRLAKRAIRALGEDNHVTR